MLFAQHDRERAAQTMPDHRRTFDPLRVEHRPKIGGDSWEKRPRNGRTAVEAGQRQCVDGVLARKLRDFAGPLPRSAQQSGNENQRGFSGGAVDVDVQTAALKRGVGPRQRRRQRSARGRGERERGGCKNAGSDREFHCYSSAESGSKICSTGSANSLEILKASGKLGAYFPVSSALTVCRATPKRSATSACDHSCSARSTRMRFFIIRTAA